MGWSGSTSRHNEVIGFNGTWCRKLKWHMVWQA